MAHTSFEIERAYDVDTGVAPPSLVGVGPVAGSDPVQEYRQEAVYYDTAERALGRRRIALRRREGGADDGWHLKCQVADGRREQAWPLSDAGRGVPPEIAGALESVTGGARLESIAVVRTRRRLTTWRDDRGRALVEFCDDHVDAESAEAGRRGWREWEVEYVPDASRDGDDPQALLDVVEVVVTAAGAHPAAVTSKLARALGVGGG